MDQPDQLLERGHGISQVMSSEHRVAAPGKLRERGVEAACRAGESCAVSLPAQHRLQVGVPAAVVTKQSLRDGLAQPVQSGASYG